MTAAHHHNKTTLVKEKRIHDIVSAVQEDCGTVSGPRSRRSSHPLLIEHCVQHGEDTEAALGEQIRFSLKALGKSD